MPSTYTSSLRLTLQATGENSGSWGTIVNNGVTSLVDSSVAGTATVTHDNTANYTLSTANGATDEARQMFLNITGTLTAARNVVCPTASKLYFLRNNTTGGFAVTLKTSAGTGISVPSGKYAALYCDGTNVVNAFDYQSTLTANTATNLAGGAAGSVPYQTSAGTTTMLAAGTNGQVLTLAGGVPTWAASSGGVTSFSAGTTGLTPNTTTTGAITLAGTLDVDNGGTGQTTYTDGQLLIGNTTGNTLAKSTLTAGSGISITNGAGSITIATSGGGGTVTSVTGTSPVVSSGGTTPAISLASGYGDTLNPYASKTANFFLSAPNGSAGVPTFRAIVAADIPTLNQNTSGTAAGLSATLAVASGGTGLTSTPANGALDIGNGTGFTRTTLTAGSGLAITNGSGSISIAASTIPVANGGTGLTSTPANGALDIGNGTGFTRTTLTAGSGISITNGAGSISIAASGGGGGGFTAAQTFTSNGTFTVPTGITTVKVTVVGGGAGGVVGGYYNIPGEPSLDMYYGGNGGGSGGSAIEYITGLTPGGTVAVTVGAAGAANGGTGGTSSFGAYCSATGGSGNNGGTGSGGNINVTGAPGGAGGGSQGGPLYSTPVQGFGGVSILGAYGRGGRGGLGDPGYAPYIAGTVGAAGVVFVEY
jgi:hypothetical protein